MGPRLEFWLEFASTYSYLAAMRIETLAQALGVAVDYRPFLLGPIFASQGWNTSPFNIYEAKGRYMWRDMERLCERYDLPLRRPSVFPRNGLLAARIAVLGSEQPWEPAFTRAVYRANFGEDREISEASVLSEILSDLGQDAHGLVEQAGSPEIKAQLREQTEAAARAGIFGAPSFIAGDELFWGNDRLEQALDWAVESFVKSSGIITI